jgi:tRNA-dihydrouridine synthase B
MSVDLERIILDPPVFLAPMAGITDVPFRDVALRCGAGLVVSEMVASAEVVQAKPSARARAELGFGRSRTAVQLAGREARWMAAAARYCAAEGARIIDINFGCPAKKVTNGLSGSALMRDPDHALRLIDAVVGAVEVPVTLKMRLGWDAGQMNAAEIAARAEAAGVRMITVHGRTRCQFYSGAADWAAIARVRRAVRIPVVANGDIVDATTARRALARSGADAVMIGRGARGRPWLLAEVAAALAGRSAPPPPSGAELRGLVCAHYEAMLGFYGRDLGLRVARKHLGWYLDAIAGAAGLRGRVLTATDSAVVLRELARGLADCGGPAEEAAA